MSSKGQHERFASTREAGRPSRTGFRRQAPFESFARLVKERARKQILRNRGSQPSRLEKTPETSRRTCGDRGRGRIGECSGETGG